MCHDFPSEELSVTRIIEFLRAETEARESILPMKVTRSTDDKCEKSSLHHVSGASFTDPCPLGSGVHHKYTDYAVSKETAVGTPRPHHGNWALLQLFRTTQKPRMSEARTL